MAFDGCGGFAASPGHRIERLKFKNYRRGA